MKKLFIISALAILSCKERPRKEAADFSVQQSGNAVYENEQKSADEAQKWLTVHVENYFAGDLGKLDKMMQDITTKDYYDYKSDAMNVDMDVNGSFTQKEFEQKWKDKFDTSKAGINIGFLISGQDWDTVKLTQCKLISQTADSFMFDVVLTDQPNKVSYPVKVKLVKENTGFLIADVLQENPEI
ncbi:hypothetical protein BAX94_04295 [Elizabethkingia meningoseptica]|uniref:DUF3828 domain-containing protein n=2 Tax=Elizabethkingia meningoseptica TaxID=238 RepID=A0A1V3U1R1_ELIME|nr:MULTISPECIES: hypothetical protein [Elizabethkingia]AQX14361.1 hypothetical protein BBD35_17270 [Elizabethkingia meningoseptica]MBG0515832.1 hypothetical protein [Elizabethkingia meningoseptica]MDE5433801.1 hypothetical protein [Elizabethkingia meningoseptica]MDE5450729.1 hypothetical protein [Elizabethkingia meningoseptica]MDE5470076.1 hypothetical protein [Elizabethkingia meningoseptica]